MAETWRRLAGPSAAKPFSSHPLFAWIAYFCFFGGAWVHPHYITLALAGLVLQPGYLKPINASFFSPPQPHRPTFLSLYCKKLQEEELRVTATELSLSCE